MENKNRYPGLQPFSEKQNVLFYGREEEVALIKSYLAIQNLIVIQSKSGLGKSSLINAGVVPALKDQYELVRVRFNDPTTSPLQIFYRDLRNIIDRKSSEVLHKESNAYLSFQALYRLSNYEESLWLYFKCLFFLSQCDEKSKIPYLVIFDQFEELLAYTDEQVNELGIGLGELYNHRVPYEFSRLLENELFVDENKTYVNKDLYDFVEAHPDWQTSLYEFTRPSFLFGIRSDRLILLHRLSTFLHEIVLNKFELKALTREKAEIAIVTPASQEGESFATRPFVYSKQALSKVLNYLSLNNKDIESSQLQVICQYLEEKVAKDKLTTVSESDIEDDLQSVFNSYYNRELSNFGEQELPIIQKFIEDNFVLEREKRRLSIDESLAKERLTSLGLDEKKSTDYLEKLTNLRIIRREQGARENEYIYELSHDTLIQPVLDSKAIRIRKENEEKLKARLVIERKKRNRKIVIGVSIVVTLLSAMLSIILYLNSENLKISNENLKIEQQKAILEKDRDALEIKRAELANAGDDQMKLKELQDSYSKKMEDVQEKSMLIAAKESALEETKKRYEEKIIELSKKSNDNGQQIELNRKLFEENNNLTEQHKMLNGRISVLSEQLYKMDENKKMQERIINSLQLELKASQKPGYIRINTNDYTIRYNATEQIFNGAYQFTKLDSLNRCINVAQQYMDSLNQCRKLIKR